MVAPVAAEIARYIAATRLVSPAIVGHSMGGTIAMMLAAHHPKLVGRVMVVDMLPQPAGLLGASAAGIGPLADGLRDILTDSPGGRRLLENLMGRFGGESGAAKKSDPDVVARASHELALLDLTPDLPRITAPMTVVYATPPAGGTTDPARIVANYKSAYAGARSAQAGPRRRQRPHDHGRPARPLPRRAEGVSRLGHQDRIDRFRQHVGIIERVVQPAAFLARQAPSGRSGRRPRRRLRSSIRSGVTRKWP